MTDPLYDIAMAAVDLKAGHPQEFDRLVETFKRLEDSCIDTLLAADTNGIMGAQARAVIVRNLRTKLETCFEIRNRGNR